MVGARASPNPKMVEFLKDLKPGQPVKFDLMPGYGGKGVRLAKLPDAEPKSAAKADDEKPKGRQARAGFAGIRCR